MEPERTPRRALALALSLSAAFLGSMRAARADAPAEPAPAAPAAPAPAAPGAPAAPAALAEPAPAEAEPPSAEPEEVNVTGTRLVETGGSVHAIKDAQLRRFSYDNVEQVVLAVPGVYVRPEDGLGLRPNIGIRGASSDRSKKVTLMEDGVLVGPAPYSAPAAYFTPLIDRMRTVRVVKGPSSILYGPQTVGGAIDFVTRDVPSQRRGTYDLALGQYGFNKQHLSFGSSDETTGFLVEGMRLGTSGFKELDGGGDTGFSRQEWMAKAQWTPDPRAEIGNELSLKLGYADETSNETYLGLTDADFRANPDRRYFASRQDRMDYHRTSIALTHKLRFSPKIDVTTTAYRHDLHRVWRKVNGLRGADVLDVLGNPGTPRNQIFRGVLTGDVDSADDSQAILIGPNKRDFVSQGVQTQVRVEAMTGPVVHKVTYGVRAHYDEVMRRHTQDGFLARGRELVYDGRPTQVTADNKAYTYALALWALDAMSLGPVTVTPGVRVEAIHAAYEDTLARQRGGATYQVVLPGASAYWAMTRDLGLLGGVHKGFTPAPPEQARTNDPEKSVNYEAGLRWARRAARVEAIGFANDYQNLTNVCEACAEGIIDKQFDAGRARIAGLELFGETELALGRGYHLPARAAYTYTYTELLTTFQSGDPQLGSVRAGDELPYVPAHQASAAVGLEKEPWGVNVAGTFVDEMWERAGRGTARPGEKTDAYFLLDASAKYRIWKFVEVYVNARNLLDDRYIASRRPFGARPGAPRWWMAGLRGEF